jgi:lysophospholipid acyltransferase (LPLAT)-like uncharacterized protein
MLRNNWRKLKRNLLSYSYAYLGKYILRALLWSCKINVEGIERFIDLASREKCILMLWHNRLALVSEILNRHAPQFIYTALISKSRDGDPLAVLAQSYKSGKAIRVPHNARHQALKKVINNLKKNREIIVITPDGPRGPCYNVKPGIALAAKEAKATIIPFTWKADRYWELNTWDNLMLPKPFSNIHVVLGEPIKIEDDSSFGGIEYLTKRLQQSLQSLL